MNIRTFFQVECFKSTINIFVSISVVANIIAALIAIWGTKSSSSLITTAGAIGIVPALAFIIAIFIGCALCKNEGEVDARITISSCCLTLFGMFSFIAGIMVFVGISQEPSNTYDMTAAICAGLLFLFAGIFHCFGYGCWTLSMQPANGYHYEHLLHIK